MLICASVHICNLVISQLVLAFALPSMTPSSFGKIILLPPEAVGKIDLL